MLKRRWQRAERDVATHAGGRTVLASGATWKAKADVSTPTHLIQVKSTEKRSYVLKLSDLALIEQQAAAANKAPRFVIEFITPNGRRRYVIEKDWTT
jgi:hypothetical protein